MTDQIVKIDQDAAGYRMNHIFLPLTLPGAEDYELKHKKYLLK